MDPTLLSTATPPPAAPGGSAPPAAPASGIDPSTDVLNGSMDFSQYGALGNLFANLGGSPQSTLAALGPDYQAAYNAYLGAAGSMYNNTIAGYQQLMANQQNAEKGVTAGYQTLGNNVQGLLQGADQSQMQQVQNQYAQNAANINASLANSGLGNTTVGGSMLTGNQQSESQAETNVANTFANTEAGYMSNIGQAGLQYQGQAINADTGLGQSQLNYMANVNIPPPDASAYGSIATQAGAAIQSGADRAQQAQEFAQLLAAAQTGAGAANGGGGGFLGSMGSLDSALPVTPGLFDSAGGPGGLPGMGGVPGLPSLGGAGASASRPLGGISPVGSPSGGGAPVGLPSGGMMPPIPGANAQGAVLGGMGMVAGQMGAGATKAQEAAGWSGAQIQQYSQENAAQNGGWYIDSNGTLQQDPLSMFDEAGGNPEPSGVEPGNDNPVEPGPEGPGETAGSGKGAGNTYGLPVDTWNSLTPAEQDSIAQQSQQQNAMNAMLGGAAAQGTPTSPPPPASPPPPSGNPYGADFSDANAANVSYVSSGPLAGSLYDKSTQTYYDSQGHAIGNLANNSMGQNLSQAFAGEHGGIYIDPATGNPEYDAAAATQYQEEQIAGAGRGQTNITQDQANQELGIGIPSTGGGAPQSAYGPTITGGGGSFGGEDVQAQQQSEEQIAQQQADEEYQAQQAQADAEYAQQVAEEQQAEEQQAAEEEQLAQEQQYDSEYGVYGGGGGGEGEYNWDEEGNLAYYE